MQKIYQQLGINTAKQTTYEFDNIRFLPQKVGFLCFTKVRNTDVRQHLLLKYFFGIFNTFLLCDAGASTTSTNEVEGNVLLLDNECLVQRRFYL